MAKEAVEKEEEVLDTGKEKERKADRQKENANRTEERLGEMAERQEGRKKRRNKE